jgi:GT2 family glycosyltransferase
VAADESVSAFVSVVVPTHDRAATLARSVASVLAVDYPRERFEVIVVDAGSAEPVAAAGVDATLVLASRDANRARNAGISAARGELIVLIDDDVVVPPGWLRAIVDSAAHWPEVECFGGPVKPVYDGELPRLCGSHELAGGSFWEGDAERAVGEVWGGNMAVRRSAIRRVGGFREGMHVHQEWEWEQRLLAAGGTIVYLPSAWLWHHVSASRLRPMPMVRQYFRRGYVRAQVGPRMSVRNALRRSGHWLGHALGTGCTRGWTETARSLGLLCGSVGRAWCAVDDVAVEADELVGLAPGAEMRRRVLAGGVREPASERAVVVQDA